MFVYAISFWWLVRVTLVIALGFLSLKFWKGVGTYKLSFCCKRNVALVVMTMLDGEDT